MDTISSNDFERAVVFNWMPVNYVNASWISQWLSSDAISSIKRVPEACATLNHFLLEEFSLTDPVEDEMLLDKTFKLLFFSQLDVNRFVLFLGLTLHNETIRNILCGNRQREIKELVGEIGYQFSIKRARFIVGQIDDYLSITQRKDVAFTPDAQGIYERCWHAGLLLIAHATRNLSDAAKNRIKLFFQVDQGLILTQAWRLDSDDGVVCKNRVACKNRESEVDNEIGVLFRKVSQEIN